MLTIAGHATKPQTIFIAQQAAYHINKCIEANKNPQLIHNNGTTIKDIYGDFKTNSGITFPLFEGASWNEGFPSSAKLAQAVGYLFGYYGVNTFVSLGVDTNWKNPSSAGTYSYELFIDQSTLAYPDR